MEPFSYISRINKDNLLNSVKSLFNKEDKTYQRIKSQKDLEELAFNEGRGKIKPQKPFKRDIF